MPGLKSDMYIEAGLYTFSVASTKEELAQVAKLNHKTFALEIPQHSIRDDGCLTDKFHDENTYLICKFANHVIGMVCYRAKRPFSLDAKIENLNSFINIFESPVEIRLLAVQKEHRKNKVFVQLAFMLFRCVDDAGHDGIVISATTRELQLYKGIGFEAFGDLVGRDGAYYQPMRFDVSKERQRVQALIEICPPEFVAAIKV